MSQPVTQDDSTIGDDVALWRRVNPDWWILDENEGRYRLSSQAFQNYPKHEAFSVSVSCDAEEEGAAPRDIVANHRGFGVAAFSAGFAREKGQGVIRVPKEGEIAHGHVVGRKSKSVKKSFAKSAVVLIEPTDRR